MASRLPVLVAILAMSASGCATMSVTDVPQPPPPGTTSAIDDDSCESAFDGVCDDPTRPAATTANCSAGTDHTDCQVDDD